MKFEYELNYDFVKEELSFKVTKQPESLRKNDMTRLFVKYTKDRDYKVKTYLRPAIYRHATADVIFIRGNDRLCDNDTVCTCVAPDEALHIAEVLKEFQKWVEENVDTEVKMTVSEIEKKLGYKIKIVAEDER